jgi:large subunit ribosomal protein L3
MKVRALLGRKIGMTQVFSAEGQVVPVSVIEAGPCVVLEKKSATGKDGYSALKIGFGAGRPKSLNACEKGYFDKLKLAPVKEIREIRMPEDELAGYEVGQALNAGLFEEGDYVSITGNTKGRGFAGGMKRFGFHGKNRTHGVHSTHRRIGSVSSNTWPARIWKGKGMPGRFGNETFTALNLRVIQVIADKNLILVNGAIPGHRNSLLLVHNSKRKWKRS